MEQKTNGRYTAIDLIRGAKRDNNSKRPYLLVNPLQGKHVPVKPFQALELFDALTDKVKAAFGEGGVLLIAFAETATAIGAAVGCGLNGGFLMQTTREDIPGAEYLYFSEVHSHATAQKLVKDGLQEALEQSRAVIFIEDEVTTGNTIKNLINAMGEEFDLTQKHLAIASLLNGMDEEAEKAFAERGIDLIYLVKSDNQRYADKLAAYRYDGQCTGAKPAQPGPTAEIEGRIDMRCVCQAEAYGRAVRAFAAEAASMISAREDDRVLILGTEEFMYPGLLTASLLEERGAEVRFHATTRSPILPSGEEEYPLKQRWELDSLYQSGRNTFVYDLGEYDEVVIPTDGDAGSRGAMELTGALEAAGNRNIRIISWCDGEGKGR